MPDAGLAFAVKWSAGITYQDDLEKHFLVNLHELLVPFLDVGGLLPGV
jgi:hypothetical protein